MADKTAALIRKLEGGWTGEARLYRVDPPMEDGYGALTDYVIVSATDLNVEAAMIDVLFGQDIQPCETYIFPASAEGEITNWTEMPGSFKGEKNHDAALVRAGYTVVDMIDVDASEGVSDGPVDR